MAGGRSRTAPKPRLRYLFYVAFKPAQMFPWLFSLKTNLLMDHFGGDVYRIKGRYERLFTLWF